MRIVLERCYNDLRLLSVPSKTLKAEGFFRSNKVFLYLFIVSLLLTNGVKLSIYCKPGCELPALSPSVCARVAFQWTQLPQIFFLCHPVGLLSLLTPPCCCSFALCPVPSAWEHFFLFPCPPSVFKLWDFCDWVSLLGDCLPSFHPWVPW